ncbi:MAG TPA: hypothetical protein VFL59_14570 [Candidatus Nanopelagicales bacterium]|nr:hypothetical protein [Candidatus Nanopelagicales bacterium]
MDPSRVNILREVLSSTGWVDRTRGFARSLRRATDDGTAQGLLLVGTPTQEPWHLAAHLDDESRYAGIPTLAPTLVRWAPPPGAPAHLAIGLERLEDAGRGETLFVVAPDDPTEQLLERLADARRAGATLLAIDAGDDDLRGLAHEELVVPQRGLTAAGEPSGLAVPLELAGIGDVDLSLPDVSFDTVQHLVSAAAGDPSTLWTPRRGTDDTKRGFRDRLAKALDSIQGQSASHDW